MDSTELTDQQKKQLLYEEAFKRFGVFSAQLAIDLGLNILPVYHDQALEGVRTYVGTFDFSFSNEQDIAKAHAILAAFSVKRKRKRRKKHKASV